MIRFALQLEPRPPGRAFTCQMCDQASMHPEGVQSILCPNCSPFVSVRTEGDRVIAVCKWAPCQCVLHSVEEAALWKQDVRAPDMVFEALKRFFDLHSRAVVELIPPPKIQVSAVVRMEAGADIATGDMVMSNGLAVGVAMGNAKKGESVEVTLVADGASEDPR